MPLDYLHLISRQPKSVPLRSQSSAFPQPQAAAIFFLAL